MAAILIYKAREARTKPYRKTEMWLYLPKHYRPPDDYAQWASATVLRETYLNFALWTSAVAVVMWAIALVIGLSRAAGRLALERPIRRYFRLPMNWNITSRLCGRRRCSIR